MLKQLEKSFYKKQNCLRLFKIVNAMKKQNKMGRSSRWKGGEEPGHLSAASTRWSDLVGKSGALKGISSLRGMTGVWLRSGGPSRVPPLKMSFAHLASLQDAQEGHMNNTQKPRFGWKTMIPASSWWAENGPLKSIVRQRQSAGHRRLSCVEKEFKRRFLTSITSKQRVR